MSHRSYLEKINGAGQISVTIQDDDWHLSSILHGDKNMEEMKDNNYSHPHQLHRTPATSRFNTTPTESPEEYQRTYQFESHRKESSSFLSERQLKNLPYPYTGKTFIEKSLLNPTLLNHLISQERCRSVPNLTITPPDPYFTGSHGNKTGTPKQSLDLTLQNFLSIPSSPQKSTEDDNEKKLPRKHKAKAKKWKMLDAIFGGRKQNSEHGNAYSDKNHWTPNPGHCKTATKSVFKNQRIRGKVRIKAKSDRARKPSTKFVSSTAVSRRIRSSSILFEEPFRKRPNQMNSFHLDVEIPTIKMDRYSVMFGGLIHNQSGARAIGSRRVTNFEKLYATREKLALKEKELDEKLRKLNQGSNFQRFKFSPFPKDQTNTPSRFSKFGFLRGCSRSSSIKPKNFESLSNNAPTVTPSIKSAEDFLELSNTNLNEYFVGQKTQNILDKMQPPSKEFLATQKPLPCVKEERNFINHFPKPYNENVMSWKEKPLPNPRTKLEVLDNLSNLFPDDESEDLNILSRKLPSKASDISTEERCSSYESSSCSFASGFDSSYSASTSISSVESPLKTNHTTTKPHQNQYSPSPRRISCQNSHSDFINVSIPCDNDEFFLEESTFFSIKSPFTSFVETDYDSSENLLDTVAKLKSATSSSPGNQSRPQELSQTELFNPKRFIPSTIISPLDAFATNLNEEIERVTCPNFKGSESRQ